MYLLMMEEIVILIELMAFHYDEECCDILFVNFVPDYCSQGLVTFLVIFPDNTN